MSRLVAVAGAASATEAIRHHVFLLDAVALVGMAGS